MIAKLYAILSVLVISSLTTIYISVKQAIIFVPRIISYFEAKPTSNGQTYYKDIESNRSNKFNNPVNIDLVNEQLIKELIKNTYSVKKCSCAQGCHSGSNCGCSEPQG